MKNKTENATVADLKNGFCYDEKTKLYSCLFCNMQYEDGDVYPFEKRFVSAEKAMKLHIAEKHGNVFDCLLETEKSQTGLTDTQKNFLKNDYSGLPDKEIAQEMKISDSTVRYQRYHFREKAKQAKFILALYELWEEKERLAKKVVKPVDENAKILETYFASTSPLVLKTFYFSKKKDEKRLFILRTITQQFEKSKRYTEKEVNAILKEIYHDFATIRRHLIEDGFMERTNDGSEYLVK